MHLNPDHKSVKLIILCSLVMYYNNDFRNLEFKSLALVGDCWQYDLIDGYITATGVCDTIH